jgi:hypothetical protein
MGQMRNTHRILMQKSLGKRPNGIVTTRWENNSRMRGALDWLRIMCNYNSRVQTPSNATPQLTSSLFIYSRQEELGYLGVRLPAAARDFSVLHIV